MKIAISSEGNHQNAKVDKHFGRCAYFVIYDTESGSTEYLPNPNKNLIEKAGPSCVDLLVTRGVKKVVSGEFGAKVKSLFDTWQIQLIILKKGDKKIIEVLQLLGDNRN